MLTHAAQTYFATLVCYPFVGSGQYALHRFSPFSFFFHEFGNTGLHSEEHSYFAQFLSYSFVSCREHTSIMPSDSTTPSLTVV